MKTICSLGLLWIGLASSLPAQSVFQAYLSTPHEGGARLDTGRFWFRVNQDEGEFFAIVFQSFISQSLDQTPPSLVNH